MNGATSSRKRARVARSSDSGEAGQQPVRGQDRAVRSPVRSGMSPKKKGRQSKDNEKAKKARRKRKSNDNMVRDTQKKVHGHSFVWRGLPAELMEKILLVCDDRSLLQLCLVSKGVQSLAAPLVYRTFDPLDWTDFVRLSRWLHKEEEGMGDGALLMHACAKNIQRIAVDQLLPYGSEREHSFITEELSDSLSHIISKAPSLRSFSWRTCAQLGKLDEVWKALGLCPLKEITLGEIKCDAAPLAFSAKSKLWSLRNLTKIDISFPSLYVNKAPSYLGKGVVRLIQRSPHLVDLKLTAINRVNNGVPQYNKAFEGIFALALPRLRSLDLENVYCGGTTLLHSFLSSLDSVEKVRCRGFTYDNDRDGPRPSVYLPALQEIDIEMATLKRILSASTPSTVVNVRACIHTESTDGLLHFLHTCNSIKELHLNVYGCLKSDEDRRQAALVLSGVPDSVQKLAIRMPDHREELSLTHASPSLNLVDALKHLQDLEVVALPWSSVLFYSFGDEIFSMTEIVNRRARKIARQLAEKCLKLKTVLFQGCVEQDLAGNPLWRVKWNELDDMGRRWTVRVTRVEKGEADEEEDACSAHSNAKGKGVSWAKKGFLKNDKKSKSCTIGQNGTANKEPDPGQPATTFIRTEVLSSACVCGECWQAEDMPPELRACALGYSPFSDSFYDDPYFDDDYGLPPFM